jgi:hypothetical protein
LNLRQAQVSKPLPQSIIALWNNGSSFSIKLAPLQAGGLISTGDLMRLHVRQPVRMDSQEGG